MASPEYDPNLDDGWLRDKLRHLWWKLHQPWMVDVRPWVAALVAAYVGGAHWGSEGAVAAGLGAFVLVSGAIGNWGFPRRGE